MVLSMCCTQLTIVPGLTHLYTLRMSVDVGFLAEYGNGRS